MVCLISDILIETFQVAICTDFRPRAGGMGGGKHKHEDIVYCNYESKKHQLFVQTTYRAKETSRLLAR